MSTNNTKEDSRKEAESYLRYFLIKLDKVIKAEEIREENENETEENSVYEWLNANVYDVDKRYRALMLAGNGPTVYLVFGLCTYLYFNSYPDLILIPEREFPEILNYKTAIDPILDTLKEIYSFTDWDD